MKTSVLLFVLWLLLLQFSVVSAQAFNEDNNLNFRRFLSDEEQVQNQEGIQEENLNRIANDQIPLETPIPNSANPIFPIDQIPQPAITAITNQEPIAKNLEEAPVENPLIPDVGQYIPVFDETKKLDYTIFKVDLTSYFNHITIDNINGFTVATSLSVLFNNVHEFGASLFWRTFSLDKSFLKPSYGWLANINFLYKFRAQVDFFSFNYGIHIGPAYFQLIKSNAGSEVHNFFLLLQPEIDFEFRMFEHFAISIPVGYALHIGGIKANTIDTSHVSVGLTWRWYKPLID